MVIPPNNDKNNTNSNQTEKGKNNDSTNKTDKEPAKNSTGDNTNNNSNISNTNNNKTNDSNHNNNNKDNNTNSNSTNNFNIYFKQPIKVEYIYINKTNITNVYNVIDYSSKKISSKNNDTTTNNNNNNHNYVSNHKKNKTELGPAEDTFHYNFNRIGVEKSNVSEFNNLVINILNPVINNNHNTDNKKNAIEDLFKNLKEEITNNTLKLRELSKIDKLINNMTNYNYNVHNNYYVNVEDKSLNLKTNKVSFDNSNNLNTNYFEYKTNNLNNSNNSSSFGIERQKYHFNHGDDKSNGNNSLIINNDINKIKKCKEEIRINNTEFIGKIINETFHDLKNDLNSQLSLVKKNLKRIIKQ